MGKDKVAATSSKKGGKDSGVKKCLCVHPFLCDCSNRPERPSRGHSWNPETQEWGGKGHRQKGGGTVQVAKVAVVTVQGGVKVEQWQSLPTKLLEDYCKSQKRPNPKYKDLGNSHGHRYRVILPDTKHDATKDLIYISGSSTKMEEQAREEGALLALLQVCGSIPHQLKLPEPYRTTWVNITSKPIPAPKAAPKSSSTSSQINLSTNSLPPPPPSTTTSKNTVATSSTTLVLENKHFSAYEKNKALAFKKKTMNDRIRHHENKRAANKDYPIFMSAAVRGMVERILRGDGRDGGDENDIEEEDENVEDDDEEDGEDELKSYIVSRLTEKGFSKNQAKKGYLKARLNVDESNSIDEEKAYDTVLSWLLLNLNENDLPEGFNPKGRTLDVVSFSSLSKNAVSNPEPSLLSHSSTPASNPSPQPSSSSPSSSPLEKILSNYSFPLNDITYLLQSPPSLKPTKSLKEEASFLSTPYSHLITFCRGSDQPRSTADDHSKGGGDTEQANDEWDALQAIIYDKKTTRISEGVHTKITIELNKPNMFLDVIYDNTKYPSNASSTSPPMFMIRGCRDVRIQVAFLKVVLDLLGTSEPIIYDAYVAANDILHDGVSGVMIESIVGLISNSRGGSSRQPSLASTSGSSNGDSSMSSGSSVASSSSSTSNPNKSSQPKKHHHTRKDGGGNRPTFWNSSPTSFSPASPFPKIPTSMKMARDNLPASKAKSEFLGIMKLGRVVLVTGETGCGKTTQIPQFLLEDDPNCKIVIAQPRRLAATGVATRVANERGENEAGRNSVGYVVRGDTAMCPSTRLLFCTTGVLLRQLQNDYALDCLTHVVIDEVHERHLDTDVLLGYLKGCLSSKPNLRVVLMSATMDADRFAKYWGEDTPRMHIKGFTHPVKDFTLYDVLDLTKYIPARKEGKKKKSSNYNNNYCGGRKATNWDDSESTPDADANNDGDDDANEDLVEVGEVKEDRGHGIPIDDLVLRVEQTRIDYDMIASLVRVLVETKDYVGDDGSILVFLPGLEEIKRCEDAIRRVAVRCVHSMKIFPLHGGLRASEQKMIFDRVSPGVVKVILSTNVAETSITIPDCVVVIDGCREKQSSYDPVNRTPMLVEKFASQDSLKQRRGRAGRVRPGVCFKLISTKTFNSLPEHGEPEIRRCALDSTLLSLMFLGVEDGAGSFLNTLIDPPSYESLQAAISCLESIGALESDETGTGPGPRTASLTPLGLHLAGIPAPPAVSKMIVMGALLGCRDAGLIIAAGMTVGRSPFLKIMLDRRYKRGGDDEEGDSPEETKKKNVIIEREKLAKSVGKSDLCLLAAAFEMWSDAEGGGGGKRKVCDALGLSPEGMREYKQLRDQLDSALTMAGFSGRDRGCNKNGNKWRVVRAVVISALCPSGLVRCERESVKYDETMGGNVERNGVAKEIKFFVKAEEQAGLAVAVAVAMPGEQQFTTRAYHGTLQQRVFIHPSSMTFSTGNYSCPWLCFFSMVTTSKAFLRDVCECTGYALLLFGGTLSVLPSEELLVVGGWARMSAPPRIGVLVKGLREMMDRLLVEKIKDSGFDLNSGEVMEAVIKLLVGEGLM